MSCEQCQSFTPMSNTDPMGYCDWLRSVEAKCIPLPITIRRIEATGIVVGRKEGKDCPTFKQRSRA